MKSNQVLKHQWYPISISKNVSNTKINKVQFNSKHFIIYRDKNGEIVFRDRWCPHRGADMSDGILKENCISCPYHGWEFSNHNGHLEKIPSNTIKNIKCGSSRVNIGINKYIYDDNDIVWYYYSTDGNNEKSCPIVFPDLRLQFNLDNFHNTQGEITINSNWLNVIENSIDPSHPNFVHENSFSDEDLTKVEFISQPTINEMENKINSVCEIYHKTRNNMLINGMNTLKKTKMPKSIGKIPVYFEMLLPNIVSIKFNRGDTTINTIVCVSPIDDENTKMYWFFPKIFLYVKIH